MPLPEDNDRETPVDGAYDRLPEGDVIGAMLPEGQSTMDALPAVERVHKPFWDEPLVSQRGLWAEQET